METFDFSNDFQIPFEPKMEYHVIITDSKIGYMENSGKQYIQHTLMGANGETFSKKFFVSSDGGKRYYTSFLASCGITKEETANWIPEKLDGKFLTVEFYNKTRIPEVYNEATGLMEPGEEITSFDLKSFRTCNATQQIKQALMDQADGSSPF